MQKTAFEIEALRRAVTISGEGHIAAMRYARPGMHEYEIQAILEFVFTSRGAQSAAYPSIVAAGANGTVLHYTANRARVRDDELVLIDAAAEVDFSCGDITRTWPMSGKFSPEQRAVYEIVLAAQQRCIELCRPGARFAGEVNDAAIRVITEGLIDLGLLRGAIDENIEEKRYRRFYMHRIGHYLGLDVHDVGFYRQEGDWRALAPGMVVTIEPGIYIPQDDDVEARFRGIAVRIEDDILITESGSDNLSSNTPKTIEDIERTIAEGRESKVPLPA
jgi:Xaa-Pro aminopeptidase